MQARFGVSFWRPRVSFILAQGSALGIGSKHLCRLKVCLIASFNPRPMKQAFSLRIIHGALPRAMPWASMSKPVGLKIAH